MKPKFNPGHEVMTRGVSDWCTDDPIDNMTYTIDREHGLRVKHSGVEL